MAKAFTPRSIEALKPDPEKRLELPDPGLRGLYLVVQKTGSKSWAVRYRHANRPTKLTLGRWAGLDVEERKGKVPSAVDGPFLTLAEARLMASRVLSEVESCIDPSEQRKAEKASKRAAPTDEPDPHRNTIETLVGNYYESHLKSLRRDKDAFSFLNRFVVRDGAKFTGRPNKENDWSGVPYRWGKRDVGSITKRDVRELLDEIKNSGRPTTSNRVRAYLSGFFNWCIEDDIIEVSPVSQVKARADEVKRDRVLTDREIILFWQACDEVGGPWGQFGKFLLLTGARLREVANMRSSELQDGVWTLPSERSKNKLPHVLPISATAHAVLASLPKITPKPGKTPTDHFFTTTGAGAISGFHKAHEIIASRMAELANEDLPEGAEPIEIPHWTWHDLRRTLATNCARLHIPKEVAEAILNHQSGTKSGVAGTYNRYEYFDEKREALEAWAAFIDRIVNGTPDNVVQLGEIRG